MRNWLSMFATLIILLFGLMLIPFQTDVTASSLLAQIEGESEAPYPVDSELIEPWLKWDAISSAFGKSIEQQPAIYTSEKGAWYFLDVERCFRKDLYCYGNNPDTPYGYPVFSNRDYEPEGSTAFMIGANEGIVLIMQTPPEVAYFGATPYVQARTVPNAIEPGTRKVILGSFTDTISHLRLNAEENENDVPHPFNSVTAFIMTPNKAVAQNLEARLIESGLSSHRINVVGIPTTSESMPLYIGYSDDSDEFSIFLRAGLPVTPEDFKLWLDAEPLAVWRIGVSDINFEPYDLSPYIKRQTKLYEKNMVSDAKLRMAKLITALKRRHPANTPHVYAGGEWVTKIGQDCIANYEPCNADNQDALYRKEKIDFPLRLTSDPDNFWYFIGVNHRKTGKATYTNHSVYHARLAAGVASIKDDYAEGSAAYYAEAYASGLDIGNYDDFYVFRVARNCTPEELKLGYCVKVPYPEPGNLVGVTDDDLLFTMSRSYVEPTSGVGPIPSELIGSMMMIYDSNK